ncbi:hypothetical protein NDU88_003360 [Pleurodeles waltl]|uniref:Uncharacterized protein n=1 Tax=Pleurodeles waltl TaxID=8319 RepID=A0AAV7W534_PLEWA|nr:hypothetical protein NDU88_003360 [Pleurodeles waltl]
MIRRFFIHCCLHTRRAVLGLLKPVPADRFHGTFSSHGPLAAGDDTSTDPLPSAPMTTQRRPTEGCISVEAHASIARDMSQD